MDNRFHPHNAHLEDPKGFSSLDPHLRRLKSLPLVYESKLLSQFEQLPSGIYTLSGGRQIGKTTLMKQWMAYLIKMNVDPKRIFYMTGELIEDHHSLIRLITDSLRDMPEDDLRYVIVDEVTYIKGWDKGIKYLADAGLLEQVAMMVTGSDMAIIRESRMRFPGRRGQAGTVDFNLLPLSFRECVELKSVFAAEELSTMTHSEQELSQKLVGKVFEEFDHYLLHGGFLTAINDMAMHQRILPATFLTYSDWIRGDVLKRNRQERYLREVLDAVLKRYGSQITWNNLAQDLSIDHPITVAEYIELLVSMDAVFVQYAILEDKLTAAPKKARKVMFTDPFIYHAINAWLHPSKNPFDQQQNLLKNNPARSAAVVEACVATHFRRKYATFYVKAQGEVDVAYVKDKRFWPIEVKWTQQLRPKQLKQISKYPNGKILTRSTTRGKIEGIPTEPLPVALLRLDV